MKRTYARLGISASVIAMLLSLSSGRPLAGETDGSSLTMGPKTILSHKAKAVMGPSVQVDEQGRAHLAWTEEDHDLRSLWHATNDATGVQISAPTRVNGPEDSLYWRQEAPALLVDKEEIFITWASTHPKKSPDKPFSNELRLSRSTDGGKTFLPSVVVNDDDQVTGHSFDALSLGRDGAVYVSWIDAREGKKDPSTYVARSDDRGKTLAKNLKLDDNTCVCCRTAMATAPDGNLYVAWRKIFEGQVREIVTARSTDGGRSFSGPVIVGNDRWVYPGCPHRAPSIGVDGQGRLYVLWYTEGQDDTPAVYVALSDDQGRTFSPKQALNASKGTFPDHPQMAVDQEGRAVAIWEEQGPVRKDVVMSYSLDRGTSWSRPHKLNERRSQNPVVSLNQKGEGALAWMEHAMPGHKTIIQPFTLPSGRQAGLDQEPATRATY